MDIPIDMLDTWKYIQFDNEFNTKTDRTSQSLQWTCYPKFKSKISRNPSISRLFEAEATRHIASSSAPATPLRLPMLLQIYRYRPTLRVCTLRVSKEGRSF